MSLAKTPDAELDVIDFRLPAIPTLADQGLRNGIEAHWEWKFKYPTVSGSDASLLAPSSPSKIVTTSFSGRMMLGIQTRRAACSSGLAAA
jgi:hypothetical protein